MTEIDNDKLLRDFFAENYDTEHLITLLQGLKGGVHHAWQKWNL